MAAKIALQLTVAQGAVALKTLILFSIKALFASPCKGSRLNKSAGNSTAYASP